MQFTYLLVSSINNHSHFRAIKILNISMDIEQSTVKPVLSGHSHSKTCVKRPLSKRPKIGFQDHLSLNAGQKYCRMFPLEHSAILTTFIKLPFVIKIFVLSIF